MFYRLDNKVSQTKSYGTRKTTPGYSKHKSESSGNVMDHIQESYDFVWNHKTFDLEDDKDSINYGELVVSPPPSG